MDPFTMALDQLVAQANIPVPIKKAQPSRAKRKVTVPKEKAPKKFCLRCLPDRTRKSYALHLCRNCYNQFSACKVKQRKELPGLPDLTVPEFMEKHPRRPARKVAE